MKEHAYHPSLVTSLVVPPHGSKIKNENSLSGLLTNIATLCCGATARSKLVWN